MPIELDPRPKTTSDETTPTELRRTIPARGVAVIVVTALLAAVPFIGASDTQDGSHAFAESQRMQSLVPVGDVVVDTSHETAEVRRFESLAPRVDNSHEVAESQRMQSLVPVGDVVVDTSHETAETRRMLTLQP